MDTATCSTSSGMAGGWGRVSGQPGFDVDSDLNNDGSINVVDLLILADTFGTY